MVLQLSKNNFFFNNAKYGGVFYLNNINSLNISMNNFFGNFAGNGGIMALT